MVRLCSLRDLARATFLALRPLSFIGMFAGQHAHRRDRIAENHLALVCNWLQSPECFLHLSTEWKHPGTSCDSDAKKKPLIAEEFTVKLAPVPGEPMLRSIHHFAPSRSLWH